MADDAYTRAEWRQLRALAGEAWARELGVELAQLEAAFGTWRAGALSPHALSERIHRFHQGAARDLYGVYTRLAADHLVARRIVTGIVSEREVSAGLLAKLRPTIAFLRTEWPAAGPAAGPAVDDPPERRA